MARWWITKRCKCMIGKSIVAPILIQIHCYGVILANKLPQFKFKWIIIIIIQGNWQWLTIFTSEIASKLAIVKSIPTRSGSPEVFDEMEIDKGILIEIYKGLHGKLENNCRYGDFDGSLQQRCSFPRTWLGKRTICISKWRHKVPFNDPIKLTTKIWSQTYVVSF